MNRVVSFALGWLLLGAVLTAWFALSGPATPLGISDADVEHETSAQIMVNRAWIQRMPKSKKDIVSWFTPMDLRGKKFGVAQNNSHYWFAGERFTWTQQGKNLRLSFQQSGLQATIGAKAYKCNTKGFDYCLDLTRKGRKVTMYSKKKWTVPRKPAAEMEIPAFDVEPVTGWCDGCPDGLPPVLDGLL